MSLWCCLFLYGSVATCLMHCFHVCLVRFSIVITPLGKRELMALLFRYLATFIRYVIICFPLLLIILEDYDLCLLCNFFNILFHIAIPLYWIGVLFISNH